MTIHLSENNEYLCKDSWNNYTELRLRQPEFMRVEDLDSTVGLTDVCKYCMKEYSIKHRDENENKHIGTNRG